jgi:hypothetical protein
MPADRLPQQNGMTRTDSSAQPAMGDHKARGRNRFAAAKRTAAGPRQARSLAKHIIAIVAPGRFQHEAPHPISSDGSRNVE